MISLYLTLESSLSKSDNTLLVCPIKLHRLYTTSKQSSKTELITCPRCVKKSTNSIDFPPTLIKTNITLVQQISPSSKCSYKTFGFISTEINTKLIRVAYLSQICSILRIAVAVGVTASKTISSAQLLVPR